MTAAVPGAGTVLVTGAAGGIGQAVVARLRADGWRVGALDLDGTRLPQAAPGLLPLVADVTDEVAVRGAVPR